MASTHIESPTMANPPTGAAKKGTWSFWIKRSALGGSRFLNTHEDGNNEFVFGFKTDDTLQIYQLAGGSNAYHYITSRKFRDTTGWYHIVLAIDTTLGTAGDRVKLYVNGVQETSFTTSTNNMPQNHSWHGLYGGIKQNIGRDIGHSTEFFDGVLSYVAFVDGIQLTPTTFGETDSTTGEWKIKTDITPGGTGWGDNGYLILKDGNSLTDQSGEGNNFTLVAGAVTKTEDCPSNIFATLNNIAIFGGNNPATLSGTIASGNNLLGNGNTFFSTQYDNPYKGLFMSTLGMTQGSGKFYCEMKAVTVERFSAGVCNKNVFLSSSAPDSQANQSAITYYYNGNIYYDSNGTVSGGVSLANGDILGIALDMDNNRLFFHKNGTYINSGDPTSSTGNVASFTNASQYLTNHEEMFFFVSDTSTSGTCQAQCNFGNGYFGTTAVSSAGTNASGVGIFEYDVPTGYTALSTKGLNL